MTRANTIGVFLTIDRCRAAFDDFTVAVFHDDVKLGNETDRQLRLVWSVLSSWRSQSSISRIWPTKWFSTVRP